MSTDSPVVLITPEAKAALEAETERAGVGGDIVGGLLFGYPLDEQHRMVISSAWLRPEVDFGRRSFCLDQSRTSQQLWEARTLSSEAHYCGVWYIHHTPDRELTDGEWVQAKNVLGDPDYRFPDVVCLVMCLYSGDLNIYAAVLGLQQAARGQLPTPTKLKLTAEPSPIPEGVAAGRPVAPAPPSSEWYKAPDIAARLNLEQKWLLRKYRVESAIAPDGKVIFRLMQKGKHEEMVFCLACEPGFPDEAPTAFLMVRGDRYPLLSPALRNWSANKWLFQVADDLVTWQVGLLDQQVDAAERSIKQGNYQEASDLLAMVLLIDPRRPRAAQLLAQAGPALSPPPPVPSPESAPEWYAFPKVVDRLQQERERLLQKYRVESAVAPDGKVVFRLMPHGEHEDLVFYIACEPGFPDEVPTAFLVVRGDRYPLLSPALSEWSADKWLVDVADDLVAWQTTLLDQQVDAAREAIEQGDYQAASDLLIMVLLMEPRRPNAAELLARAQSMLEQQHPDEQE